MNRLIERTRSRLNGEEGFTLIELLVVIVIIGILLAIAVPSYLGFRGRAQDATAESNVREAIPAAEAYYSDWGNYNFNQTASGTVAATPAAALVTYDSGLSPNVTVKSENSGAGYCIYATGQTGKVWYDLGPGGTITSAATVAATGC